MDGNREKNNNSSAIDVQSITKSSAKLTEVAGYHMENGNKINHHDNDIYDPFSNRDMENGTSDFGALVHLFKGCLASGILAVPRAYMYSGIILGIIGTMMIGMICVHTVSILVKCSHILSTRVKKPFLEFPETAEVAFKTGPKALQKYSSLAKQFVTVSLFTTLYLGNTVILILISQAFKEICNNYFGFDLTVRWYILIMGVLILPLGVARRLKYLVPVSAFGAVFIIFGLVVTLSYAVQDLPPIDKKHLTFSSVGNLPSFVATVLFALEGIGTILPIENSMKHPQKFRGYCGILSMAMCFNIVLFGVLGSLCYLKYGDGTRANITLNLPHDVLSESVKLLVALSLLSTYNLQMWAPSEIVWNQLKTKISVQFENLAYYLMRASMVIGTVIIALIVPNLAPFISLVGSVCLSILGLWTPAMIEIVTYWEESAGNWRVGKNIIIMVFSIAALLIGGYSSIEEIIQFYQTPHE